jgi:hypothetical protein
VADVFLLYRHEDADRAQQLAAVLERHGWSVWSDRAALAGNWRATIDPQLRDAKCVVLLFSHAALNSEIILRDAAAAAGRKVLVGARLERAPMPLGWRYQKFVELTGWDGAADDERLPPLIARIEDVVSRQKEARLAASTSVPDWVAQPAVAAALLDNSLTPPAPVPGVDAAVTTPAAPRTLFICYRREDTEDAAGRLKDHLAGAYSAERVFMDIDSIPLGIDFVDHVNAQIAQCSVVIVMIGRQWLSIRDKKRRRRLDDVNDMVRVEVAAALKQQIPVIPVVVQSASMPTADELPEDIRLLARRNGIRLQSEQWKDGVDRLLRELERYMK